MYRKRFIVLAGSKTYFRTHTGTQHGYTLNTTDLRFGDSEINTRRDESRKREWHDAWNFVCQTWILFSFRWAFFSHCICADTAAHPRLIPFARILVKSNIFGWLCTNNSVNKLKLPIWKKLHGDAESRWQNRVSISIYAKKKSRKIIDPAQNSRQQKKNGISIEVFPSKYIFNGNSKLKAAAAADTALAVNTN